MADRSADDPSGGAGPGTGAGTGGTADGGSERQVPFFCPYCGEEDLRPAGAAAGQWHCPACARSFHLRFAGVTQARAS